MASSCEIANLAANYRSALASIDIGKCRCVLQFAFRLVNLVAICTYVSVYQGSTVGEFYRFEHIVPNSSGKVVTK